MKQKFLNLTKDGGALYGFRQPFTFARAGITTKGRVWLQIGEVPLLLPALDEWTEDGCGLAAKGRNGERLYLVKPEDADDFQYGVLLDDIAALRGQFTEETMIELLGDDA